MSRIVLGLLVLLCASCSRTSSAAEPTTPIEPVLIATPLYPEAFQKAHFAGTVVVSLHVASDGAVSHATLVTPNASKWLNKACLDAAERSRFKALGSDRQTSVNFTYIFALTASSPIETYALIDPVTFTIRIFGYFHPQSISQGPQRTGESYEATRERRLTPACSGLASLAADARR